MIPETEILAQADTRASVSWAAVLAGSTITAALTLMLLAFGIGVGFSVVSPWSDSGISSTTFTISAGIYLIVVAMLASTVGGYVAGRLRAKWTTVHEHERYFRDTAHGFLTWAFATIVGAALLGGAATHFIAGVGASAAPAAVAASQRTALDGYVDTLLRADPASGGQPAAGTNNVSPNQTSPLADSRREVGRILAAGIAKGSDVSAADRTYLAKVVAARSGLSQADAEQRVNQTITQAKAAADAARKSTARFSLWLVASMLAGALAASLAAVEGGNLRNREWYLGK
jgi:hypothetical protein